MNITNTWVGVIALATLAVSTAVTAETIVGTARPDDLYGTPGDDTINGRGGADTMTGLGGNDIYYVDNYDDAIVENAGGGKDTVRSKVNLILPANVENLRLIGTGDIAGYGNQLPNRIVGNAGNSYRIDGGPGNDVLLGSAGSDAFRFSTPLNASTNVDKLPDFDEDEDWIVLCGNVFPINYDELVLYPGQFHVGPSAKGPWPQIVYNPTTGVLNYDSDGSGPNLAVPFARLPPDTALTSSHFILEPGIPYDYASCYPRL